MRHRHPVFKPFGGRAVQYPDQNSARTVVLPVCYEQSPSYGTGSQNGPYHILDASEQLEDLDENTLIEWTQLNIHTLPVLNPSDQPETAMQQIYDAARPILNQSQFLLTLGGDHAISVGTIRAATKVYKDVAVLQIDAHLDLRDEWNGSRYNHACVMRRVIDDYRVPVFQVGIRAIAKEENVFIQSQGLSPLFMHMIDPFNLDWIDQLIKKLPQNVYLSFDLDGLDPAVLPGTGTPEPGGFTYNQVRHLIQRLGQQRQVVAADIVELMKIEGSHVSEFTAAKIAQKMLVSFTGNDVYIKH
jgi:N1-aminopropylagmatine ureohydrolase